MWDVFLLKCVFGEGICLRPRFVALDDDDSYVVVKLNIYSKN